MTDRDLFRVVIGGVVIAAWIGTVIAGIVVDGYDIPPSVTGLAATVVTGIFAERFLGNDNV